MAKQQQDWLQWRPAIDKELAMLSDLDCFEEVLLADVAIDPKTGRRYDLKMKFDAMGLATKYKARLVALGDQEWKDTLRDVFSPTANSKTINLLLALAAQRSTVSTYSAPLSLPPSMNQCMLAYQANSLQMGNPVFGS